MPAHALSCQEPASGRRHRRTLSYGEVIVCFPFRLGTLVREIGDRDVSGVLSLSRSSLCTVEQWLSSTPPPECLVSVFLPCTLASMVHQRHSTVDRRYSSMFSLMFA